MKSLMIVILTMAAFVLAAFCDEIHTAAENGDVAALQSLLQQNPSLLTVKDSGGNAPLHSAAIKGQLEAVKYLIAQGCPVDIGDNENTTPLQVAGMNGHLEVVKYLHKKGADVHHIDDNTFTSLRWAAYFGRTEVVEYLISNGVDVKYQDRNQQTALHGASAYGHIETIKALVKAGADMQAVNRYNFTPLVSAIWAGKMESFKTLLDLGADARYKNSNREEPVFFAAMRGNLEALKLLVEKGADVNCKSNDGWTPLMASAREGNVEIAQYLLEHGADIKNTVTEGKQTLLHTAIWSDSVSMVKFLIDKKLDVNAKNNSGMTPFLAAVPNGNFEMIAALIAGGAKVNDKYKDTGKTPLHIAATKGYGELVELMIKNGAKINAKDKNGKTPLTYALKYEQKNAAEILMANGAKLNGDIEIVPTEVIVKKELDKGQAILWYLGNCGFAVKTQNEFMIFDYWQGRGNPADNPCLANGYINPEILKGQKVTVFVTHEHGDHMDEIIFGWKQVLPDAKFVLGFKLENFLRQFREDYSGFEYTYMAPRTTAQVGDIAIRTLKANDAGVGYLVEVDGLKLYHAGDHAGWNEGEREGFTSEIDYLAPYCENLDMAFLNVTGCHAHGEAPLREGTYYTLDKLQPKMMIPTHGLDREEVYGQFVERMKKDGYYVKTFTAENRGDWFEYSSESLRAQLIK